MKSWNRIGKIKAGLLVLFGVAYILLPPVPNETISEIGLPIYFFILFFLLFGILITPFVSKVNEAMGNEIVTPHWNDFSFRQPLWFFQFMAYFMLVAGFGSSLSTAIRYDRLNELGIGAISMGIGILIGIWITLRLFERRESRS